MYLVHPDHLNTPRLATDAARSTVWRHDGNAFGDTLPNEDPDGNTALTTVNLRFPGQYYDAETKLHYNWYRYYDPRIGRYLSSDPMGLAGGLNTNAYVDNNPLGATDPSGLATVISIEGGTVGSTGGNNASVVVLGGNKGLISPIYPGSTLPGNPGRCATIQGGIYDFTAQHHSKYGKTVLRLSRGGSPNLPVVGGINPNPTSDSARGLAPRGTANGVLNHPSYTNPDNGLCGCTGVRNDRYNDYISNFNNGDTGTMIIIRLPSIPSPPHVDPFLHGPP